MWKWIIIILSTIGILGYFGYNFAISKASDLMVDQITIQVLNNEDEFNKLMNDPDIQKIIKEVENISIDKELAFETKEEAIKIVVKEFSIAEITDISNKAQSAELNAEEILTILQDRLSEQEIEALKIIVIRELQNKQSN